MVTKLEKVGVGHQSSNPFSNDVVVAMVVFPPSSENGIVVVVGLIYIAAVGL